LTIIGSGQAFITVLMNILQENEIFVRENLGLVRYNFLQL
jgi:hypothetical protein